MWFDSQGFIGIVKFEGNATMHKSFNSKRAESGTMLDNYQKAEMGILWWYQYIASEWNYEGGEENGFCLPST